MSQNRTFKKKVRARMAETGEKYTQARRALLSAVCTCGHTRADHGRAAVDADRSCFSCGCWGFEEK